MLKGPPMMEPLNQKSQKMPKKDKTVDHANPVTWWLNDDLDCDQELRLPQKSRGCESEKSPSYSQSFEPEGTLQRSCLASPPLPRSPVGAILASMTMLRVCASFMLWASRRREANRQRPRWAEKRRLAAGKYQPRSPLFVTVWYVCGGYA